MNVWTTKSTENPKCQQQTLLLVSNKCFESFYAKLVSFDFTAIYEYCAIMLVDVEWAGPVFAAYVS